ncbi:MAG: NAD(P)/FAD-dependent oxidoreductase [Pseudomonadota bacterium]
MFDHSQSGDRVAVIGGGPAGLTTAYELSKIAPDHRVDVFEGGELVGGISRTESYNGFRIDIGGHRFFTKIPEVQATWKEILGDEFIRVPRLSRIYYRNKFYNYPLKLFNALGNIGFYESTRIMLSYLKWQLRPHKGDDSFEGWVINRFGGRLYMHFFASYTRKVWGIHPRNIQADWAAQRIKSLTLWGAVRKALTGSSDATSLIEEFDYPVLGPGQMWERCVEKLEAAGQSVHMRHWVQKLERDGNRITAAIVKTPDGETKRVEADHFINSMALDDLIGAIDPPPPAHVVAAAEKLKYRDFLIVALLLDDPDPFPDNWVYVHSGDVRVGRIQNVRAWSRAMVPNDSQASIGMEYFCNVDDEMWAMEDADLIKMAGGELEALSLGRADKVVDGKVIRQPKAYPVYDTEYKEAVDTISDWIKRLENLQSVGRNGLHRYNNQDHSMLTGIYAARNIMGEAHDLWDVNVERSYHEEMEIADKEKAAKSADRETVNAA